MDYTPISARRVLVGFALTAFVAFLPVLYVLLKSGRALPFASDGSGVYGAIAVMAGVAFLAAVLIVAVALMVALVRRAAGRPTNA